MFLGSYHHVYVHNRNTHFHMHGNTSSFICISYISLLSRPFLDINLYKVIDCNVSKCIYVCSSRDKRIIEKAKKRVLE